MYVSLLDRKPFWWGETGSGIPQLRLTHISITLMVTVIFMVTIATVVTVTVAVIAAIESVIT